MSSVGYPENSYISHNGILLKKQCFTKLSTIFLQTKAICDKYYPNNLL